MYTYLLARRHWHACLSIVTRVVTRTVVTELKLPQRFRPFMFDINCLQIVNSALCCCSVVQMLAIHERCTPPSNVRGLYSQIFVAMWLCSWKQDANLEMCLQQVPMINWSYYLPTAASSADFHGQGTTLQGRDNWLEFVWMWFLGDMLDDMKLTNCRRLLNTDTEFSL